MQIIFFVFLFILGSCIGSFLCCSSRRLHIASSHTKKKKTQLGNRSVCLKCHYQLRWYDNIPIFSWLVLGGKCRKCRKKIGAAEIISEIATAISFVAVGTTIDFANAIPLEWFVLVSTILLVVNLMFLAIYDGIYGELPTKYLVTSVILGLTTLVFEQSITLTARGFSPEIIIAPLASCLILGGIYLVLYLVSKGKWVGDGDWILGTAIGLALGSPWLAILALFTANFLALLYAFPTMKKHKNHQIHFGPFMVAAFVIVFTFSKFLTEILVA